jgi:hypothetical protein
LQAAYMEQEEYRGNVIHFVVEKRSDRPYWNATGYTVSIKLARFAACESREPPTTLP